MWHWEEKVFKIMLPLCVLELWAGSVGEGFGEISIPWYTYICAYLLGYIFMKTGIINTVSVTYLIYMPSFQN